MRISDWSSDVCSSDLLRVVERDTGRPAAGAEEFRRLRCDHQDLATFRQLRQAHDIGECAFVDQQVMQREIDRIGILLGAGQRVIVGRQAAGLQKIGRASWRERVWKYVEISEVGVSLKKKREK